MLLRRHRIQDVLYMHLILIELVGDLYYIYALCRVFLRGQLVHGMEKQIRPICNMDKQLITF